MVEVMVVWKVAQMADSTADGKVELSAVKTVDT